MPRADDSARDEAATAERTQEQWWAARIQSVTCQAGRQALRAPFRTSLRQLTELEVVHVVVDWTNGGTTTAAVSPTPPITGETAGSVQAAIAGPLLEAVQGVPLAEHDAIFRRLHRAIKANTTAKCAIDLAVHSALGVAAGGLRSWLGVPAKAVRTDMTVSLDSPQSMAAVARKRLAEGFDLLKLKLGQGKPGDDIARVTAVADAVGSGATLRLDANQAWTPSQAVEVLGALDRAGVRPELVEQPVAADDLAGMATVRRWAPVPVLADESVHSAHDVFRLAQAEAADLVNIKLAKCGGLWAARDVLAAASACGLGVIVGCMLEPAPTVAAAAVFASGVDTPYGHDLDAAWWSGDEQWLACRPPMVFPVVADPLVPG